MVAKDETWAQQLESLIAERDRLRLALEHIHARACSHSPIATVDELRGIAHAALATNPKRESG